LDGDELGLKEGPADDEIHNVEKSADTCDNADREESLKAEKGATDLCRVETLEEERQKNDDD
jgi:hypothetical protein